jgi:hypothetical protein
LIFVFSFSACNRNDNKSPLVPDNGLNPDLIKNPASASGENNSGVKVPVFSFQKEIYNFGIITEGDKVSYSFSFVNTGNADLIISDASASCGCTVPEFSKTPVAPGKSGTINVIFNSTGKDGYQRKEVFVRANTIPNTKKLILTGTVVKKRN